MAGAPYQVTAAFSDDEPVSIPLDFENDDGTPFDLTNYQVEYAVRDERGRRALTLLPGAGVTLATPVSGHVDIMAAPGALRPGDYYHFGRLRYVPAGRYMTLFDGPLEIFEGGF
jgi:hypothetical protein